MGSRIDSDKLSSIISEIQKRLEDLKTRCTSDPDNAKEILSDALEQLQATSQQLSSIGAAVVGQDITECKREDEALNESEEKFRASFENSMDAILLTSPDDGMIEAANPAACQMFGMTEEEIIRVGRSGIVDTKDPRFEGAIEERARTQRFRGEVNHKRKDGTIFPAEVSTALFKDKNGKVKTTMIIRDITERKLMEEKMMLAKLKAEDIARSKERQFREMEATFSSIADGVVVSDKSANITYMNKVAKRISGLVENDFTRPFAERIKSIISPNGIPFRYEELPFNRALKGEIVRDFEMVADHGPGMKFTVLASAATIYDDNSEIVGVVSTMKDITERKEAELKLVEAIKKAEQNQLILDAVIQQMPAGVIITDASGTTAKNNEAMDRIWKREMLPTENIESHGYRAFHPDGSEYLPDEWPLTRALKRGEITIGEEMSILRGDGTKGIVHVSSTPIKDKNGKTIAGVVVDVDITKQKQMEDELRRAKVELEQRVQERTEELEAVYNSAPVGLCVLGTDTRFLRLNEAFAEMDGLPIEEHIGKTVHDINPDLANAVEELTRKVVEAGEPILDIEIQGKTRAKPGVTRYWIESWLPLKDDQGDVKGINIVACEITERKQAEEKLKKQAFMLDSVSDAVIGLDMNYTINYWNSPAEEMYGYRAEDVLGRTSLEILRPEYPGMTHEDVLDRIVSTGQIRVESIHYAKDGHRIFVELQSQLLYDNEGKPSGLLGIVRDITEHKRAENELVKAKEAAEAATKIKTAFMANMSHELRTPMNYIVGMTSLLLDEPLTPELKDYIETIRKGSDEMMALINSILDFSKVEKEELALEYHPLSLRALVEDSLDVVASQAARKSLNLAYTIKHGTPDNIVGDQGRLSQILVNLLSNAVKFTDEGEISVSVSSKSLQKTNMHQILFTVKDTGIGIPPERMSELFQPFAQVETEFSRKRDGIGLGLAANKKLVELMGGEIWAKSEVGKGSTFYFTVEAEIASNEYISIKPSETIRSVPRDMNERHPLCILVAEDTPSNQQVLLKMLERMGYRADAVADGKEVLQALEMRPYDLILMDVEMPEMDGIEVAKEIRRRWPNDGPKIIAITAYALQGDKEKCLAAGMDGYIAKPVQIEDLAEVLNRYQQSKNS